MNEDAKANSHERNAAQYLGQTESEFFVSPATGLYQPKSAEPKQEINVHVDANLESQGQSRERPKGTLEDSVANFLSGAAVLVSLFTLIGLAFTVKFAYSQWQEMVKAANASRDAANISALSLQSSETEFLQTLQQMQAQTKAQVEASGTAKKTLEVSERAYLSVGGPVISGKPIRLDMPIFNTGHIPAKDVSFLVFEETDAIAPPSITSTAPSTTFLEGHWSQWDLKEVVPPASSGTAIYSITVTSNPGDADEVAKGNQIIIVAGSVSYNYGFPKTPSDINWFCFHSFYDAGTKANRFIPCDAEAIISLMKKVIQYPNNYQPAYK